MWKLRIIQTSLLELNEDMVYENRASYLSPLRSRTLPSLGVADKSKDRVIINVGGYRHECYISTIQSFPDTRLYWIAETALKMADFDPEGNEFFFDRHPGCFQNILNYCRTGQLHCPNDICGPLFEQVRSIFCVVKVFSHEFFFCLSKRSRREMFC